MITAPDHLVLTVRDLQATIWFYVEGLGYGSRPSASGARRCISAARRSTCRSRATSKHVGSSDLRLCRSLLPDRAAACRDRHAPGIARLSDHLRARTAHRRDPPPHASSAPATPTAISSSRARSRHEPSRLSRHIFLSGVGRWRVREHQGRGTGGAGRARDCRWGARPCPGWVHRRVCLSQLSAMRSAGGDHACRRGWSLPRTGH